MHSRERWTAVMLIVSIIILNKRTLGSGKLGRSASVSVSTIYYLLSPLSLSLSILSPFPSPSSSSSPFPARALVS